jgi:two-component system, chemotaxis family, chemotaxis protein CheY
MFVPVLFLLQVFYGERMMNEHKIVMRQLKLLLVDDDPNVRKTMLFFLKRMPHVEVVGEAVDGNDALAKAESLMPDIVLMDVMMPKRTGIEAARVIKQRWPAIRVMLCATQNSLALRRTVADVKADGLIVKSSLMQKLLQFVVNEPQVFYDEVQNTKERELSDEYHQRTDSR